MHTVMITGASRGIGLATAKAFAGEGFRVAICGRDEAALQNSVASLKKIIPSENIISEVCDVTRSSDLQKFTDIVRSRFSFVDVLVNNAGIFIPGNVHNEAEGVFEKQINTNLASAYHLTRMVLPLMPEHRESHIFNICSTASIVAYPNGGSYCISKFALYGFTKVLREEMKPKGIRVTAVLPGATLTDSWAGTELPSTRFLQAEDVAASILGCWKLSANTVVEELLIRPMQGDIS